MKQNEEKEMDRIPFGGFDDGFPGSLWKRTDAGYSGK